MKQNLRHDIRKIFDAGLQAADPRESVKHALRYDGKDTLHIGDQEYNVRNFRRILIVGAGKAAAPMADALEEMLGSMIATGTIITKYGHGLPLKIVSLIEAGHPVPDDAGLAGTRTMLSLIEDTDEKDLIFCLISGGGSALMPLPVAGISLEDKQKTTQELLACGATIHEINAIRKHISSIKGGKLAEAAYPGTLIALILSDVIGDNLDVIASGPTVPDMSTYADCIAILKKYNLTDKIPRFVMHHIRDGLKGSVAETPKPDDPIFEKSSAYIVGSLSHSIAAAKEQAKELGYNTMLLSSYVEGETKDVAKVHAAVIKEIVKSGNPVARPACIISGGETTVTIRGNGLGGRNLEFVLAASLDIDGIDRVAVLSGGTDGTDGPTDAAGAIADGKTMERARERGFNGADYLANNDSYHFFEGLDDLLITGPTMTNVMDLRIILVGAE